MGRKASDKVAKPTSEKAAKKARKSGSSKGSGHGKKGKGLKLNTGVFGR